MRSRGYDRGTIPASLTRGIYYYYYYYRTRPIVVLLLLAPCRPVSPAIVSRFRRPAGDVCGDVVRRR